MRSYLERYPLPEKLIMERGPWSSLSVLIPAAKLHPTLEGELYEDAYRQRILRSFLPDAIIYVDTPAEVCFQRMMNRGIDYEADIELPYLTKIETLYKDALDGYDGFVYKVDGTLPKHILAQKVARLINHIYDLQQLTVDHPFPTFIPPALPEPSIQQELELAQYKLLITQETDNFPPVEPLTECTLPGGTALAALGQTRPEVPAPTTVYPSKLNLEVDALVLYQQGPGKLEFSKEFVREYQDRYRVPPCIFDRVDCYETVNVMGRLGFEASMGPDSSPALAVVPRRAVPGLHIKIMSDGSEWVEVCPDSYAIQRTKMCPQQVLQKNPLSVLEGNRMEGISLASSVRSLLPNEGPGNASKVNHVRHSAKELG